MINFEHLTMIKKLIEAEQISIASIRSLQKTWIATA